MARATHITAGSFSRLDDFESCPRKAKYKYIDKIPEPDRGPPPRGMKEWANDRGSRIHDLAEEFVNGHLETLPQELIHFSTELWQARHLFEQGKVETEDMWCYDEDWNPVAEDDYKNTRFRLKIDLTVEVSPTHAIVIDYKTGKRYGNEVKHNKQTTLYSVMLFRRKPKVQRATAELWYLDLPDEDIFPVQLTRKQGAVLLRGIDARNKRMLTATSFPTNANAHNCRFCPYNGKNGEQVCPDAVVTAPKKR